MITVTLSAMQVVVLAGSVSALIVTTLALALTVVQYAARDYFK